MRSLALLQLLAAISAFLFLSCHSFTPSEVSALVAFKESIYDDPHSVLSNWNAFDEDPCDWTGIYCSPTRDHVLTLNLSSSFLKGFIARELGSLTNLQQLVLHKNNLLGPIPREIGKLASLKLLDLGMNQLSGPIPSELGYLTNVMKINLQSNELTGSIPPELGNLIKLADLRLDRNKLQGILPGSSNISANFRSDMHGMYAPRKNATGLCRLLQLRIADFSDNSFVGKIPPCLKYLPRSSFQGNCFQDRDSNLQHSNTQRCDVMLGAFLSPYAPLYIWAMAYTWDIQSMHDLIPTIYMTWHIDQAVRLSDSEMLKDVVRISRQELEVACEDFSNIIGSSPDSLVYKGTMKDGPEIAVISLCISEDHWTGYLELYFQSEVADLARLNHDNTAKLLGYCKESNPFSRMLVFEYASNGTLYEHLHYGEGCHLSWIRRMKIIVGIARGLKYLHTELQPPFTVSELSSNSIYLTEDFSPKLVDFERWKTVLGKSEKNSGSMGNGGSYNGFPGSLERRHLDVQGNMFAFGVLLLEIVSGRPPYCKDGGGCLLDWAKEYLELPEVISYLVDPELRYFRYDDLKVICEVANLCFQSNHPERPSMQSLTTMLENGIETDLKESPLAWAELALSS